MKNILIYTKFIYGTKANLGKAPTFEASFKFWNRFFSCFSTRLFFSARLLAKGSCPGSANVRNSISWYFDLLQMEWSKIHRSNWCYIYYLQFYGKKYTFLLVIIWINIHKSNRLGKRGKRGGFKCLPSLILASMMGISLSSFTRS